MGYSSSILVQQILANALTRGSPSAMPVQIVSVGKEVRDTVTPETIVQYIRWADEQLDSALSVIYKVPLKRVVKAEYKLLSNVVVGATSVSIEDTTRFLVGDIAVINDRLVSEQKTISAISSETSLTVNVFTHGFLASDSVAQRIGYPDPISLISARFAAANLYDKYFAAQVSPNNSDYGKNLRLIGENDLNSVLNGRVLLFGQKILGRRFFNPALLDVNAIASTEKNREKPNG